MPVNKRGSKGATGPGKGFSTHSQAGSTWYEDEPGWDPRTHGDRRYGKGAQLPGGKKAGVRHGQPGMTGQAGQQKYVKINVSKKAIKKRLGLPKGKESDIQDRRPGKAYKEMTNYKKSR